MKTTLLACAALGLGILALPTLAENALPNHTPVKIIQTNAPVYPPQMLAHRTGEVRLAISVDEQGRLKDTLVLTYTKREFADSAVRAVNAWRFEPAQVDGQPVSATLELTFNFETKGAVVSLTQTEAMEAAFFSRHFDEVLDYGVASTRELDAQPAPVSTVTPAYPRALANAGAVGQVTVLFYIDETGAVRMPAVAHADDLRLVDLAVDAIRRWKFSAPTKSGGAVPVRASQSFTFMPAAESGAKPGQ